jgi:hypothetical protein
MKTKLYGALALTFAAAATLTGCDKMAEPSGLAVEYIGQTIPHDGGTVEFTVHPGAMNDWTIRLQNMYQDQLDWLTLSSTSGSGETLVTATVQPNTNNRSEREILATVTAADRKIPVRIVQEADPDYFAVFPGSLTGLPAVENNYLERQLTVESTRKWYATVSFPQVETRPWATFLVNNSREETVTYGSASEPIDGNDTFTLVIQNFWPSADEPSTRTTKNVFHSSPDGTVLYELELSQNAPLNP